MASVDDIFKSSGLPTKRKLESVRDPNEIYKSAKISADQNGRHAHVEDDEDLEAGPAPPGDDEDGDFGPELPPDEGDDEEGRFFGGGITQHESEVLDYVDRADNANGDAAPARIDASWLRKAALNFEKSITKNAELRAKYESDPQKFIASEADLDAAIKSFSAIAEQPGLYTLFAEVGCVASLTSLLAHENTDIAIDAVEILGELIDDDIAAEDEAWNALVDAALDADLLSLLASNLSRLNEADEADRDGVYHILGVLESLCSRPTAASRLGEDTTLLKWLLARIQKRESPVGQNKQYAAEIIAIMAQASPLNRPRLLELDAIDTMLQLVAAYRKRDPDRGSDEEEFMGNLFEALTCFVDVPAGKEKFLAAEGVELCLIMLKEGKLSKPAAARLLDHAATSDPSASISLRVVEAGGLKTAFTIFTKSREWRVIDSLLGLFSSMLRRLPHDSPERIRLLAKFVEKDYEKLARLAQYRARLVARLAQTDEIIAKRSHGLGPDSLADLEAEFLALRMEAGMYELQTVDVINAWLCAEDGGAKRKIRSLLSEGGGKGLADVRKTILEQVEGIDTSEEDGRDLKDMLDTLVEFLD